MAVPRCRAVFGRAPCADPVFVSFIGHRPFSQWGNLRCCGSRGPLPGLLPLPCRVVCSSFADLSQLKRALEGRAAGSRGRWVAGAVAASFELAGPLRRSRLFVSAVGPLWVHTNSATRTKWSPRQRSSGGSWQGPGIGAPAGGPGCPLGGWTRWRAAWPLARGGCKPERAIHGARLTAVAFARAD